MANQPKKYKKFVATAATATLVASAIVPVASADAGFTDISNYDAEVQGYITDLADRGIIKGTSETTFSPSTHISRGQVVKLLGRYLVEEKGYEIPEDWEESRFTDVDTSKDEELAKYAAVVFDAEVFTGNNGALEATKKISRQNMAVVLDRAAEAITGTSLVELAAESEEESTVTDLETAKESARDAIEALNILGISTVENFNPLNNVSRANFAKFLYLTIEQIGEEAVDYEAELEEALAALAELEEVTEENAEEAQELVDAAQAALDAAVEAEVIEEEAAAEIQAQLDAVQAQINAIVGEEVEGVISQVSAINGTTVEVTLEKAVTAAPAASEFSIPGLTVSKVEIKAESDNRVLVLTTSPQTVTTYNLTYSGQTQAFIGKNALGTVLLKANKERVEIDPNLNTLPTVDIQVELSTDFPEGAEAVIEFQTSFGQVVKVQTTKGGKTSFTLTPEKTLFSQVARVTGKVIEVKNPSTGETYPDFRNATVNTVNVQFDVKPNNQTDTVEVFQFSTAYAEQADRVVLRVDGAGVTETMQKALNAAPLAKVAALTNNNITGQQNLDANTEVAKEFYTLLHDVLYSNMADKVDVENAKYIKGVQNKSDALKNAEAELNKYLGALKPQDLRNVLYKDVIGTTGNRFEAVYKPVGATQAGLYAAITEMRDAEFQDIINYYKLLSKFVVLDNVRDTAAPQSPNNIFAVEHVYAADNKTLVLVLPGDRSTQNRDFATKRYEQNRKVSADTLQDNVSHQVVFLNNIEKDRYQLTGAPTFKLEDANNVELISVDGTSAAVRYKAGSPSAAATGNFCPTPFAVDVKQDAIVGGGTTTTTPNQYVGTALTAKNYTISDYFMKTEGPSITNDELGEVLVVFSEAVSTRPGASNVLDPKNWVVDGVNLEEAVKEFGGKVQIRLVSTDVNKQLRDAVIITFASDHSKTDGGTTTPGTFKDADGKFIAPDTTLINKFIEKATYGTAHKLEVSKLGDWAAVTDNKNIVPTQTLDYAARTTATQWGSATTTAAASGTQALLPDTNAFVVRAAGEADITKGISAVTTTVDNKDIVRILFSEPMQQDGAQSVLNKENYKINGKELPVDGTSIRVGLEGVAGFENSPCAVTIQLPDNTLTNVTNKGYDNSNGNDNIIAVSNVRGYDDNGVLQEDLQLAYARQLTLVGNGNFVVINGTVISKDGLYNYFNNKAAAQIAAQKAIVDALEELEAAQALSTPDAAAVATADAKLKAARIAAEAAVAAANVNPEINRIKSHSGVSSIESRVYRDIKGNVIEFSNSWVNSANFFLQQPVNASVNKIETAVTPLEKSLEKFAVEIEPKLKAALKAAKALTVTDEATKAAKEAAVKAAEAALDAELAKLANVVDAHAKLVVAEAALAGAKALPDTDAAKADKVKAAEAAVKAAEAALAEAAAGTVTPTPPTPPTPAEQAAPVVTAINALPATVALTDKAAIEAARAAYTALSAEAKAAVTNLPTLVAAEAALAALEATPTTPDTAVLEGLDVYTQTVPTGKAFSALGTVKEGTDFDAVKVYVGTRTYTAVLDGNKFSIELKALIGANAEATTAKIEVLKGTEVVHTEDVAITAK